MGTGTCDHRKLRGDVGGDLNSVMSLALQVIWIYFRQDQELVLKVLPHSSSLTGRFLGEELLSSITVKC